MRAGIREHAKIVRPRARRDERGSAVMDDRRLALSDLIRRADPNEKAERLRARRLRRESTPSRNRRHGLTSKDAGSFQLDPLPPRPAGARRFRSPIHAGRRSEETQSLPPGTALRRRRPRTTNASVAEVADWSHADPGRTGDQMRAPIGSYGVRLASRSSMRTVTVSPSFLPRFVRRSALIGSLCVPSPRAMKELWNG